MNSPALYDQIVELLQVARQQVVRAVNQTMVLTYFEIGRMIVEDEQQGQERAAYGKQVLKELSQRLSRQFGKGFSVENLDRMRYFYKVYSLQISSTPLTKFTLSWSHYLLLMRITNEDERSFYEIEAQNSGWSLRELERQFNSALYERLVLSRDKEAVKELAMQGQTITTPADVIKDDFKQLISKDF